jgi:hypothetical protein
LSEQGKTYAAFVESELKVERERRNTYDSRGQTIVTASASLAALLTALAAVLKTDNSFRFPLSALIPLAAGVVGLAAAAGLGIMASWNFRYRVPKTTTLRSMVRGHWKDHEVDARNVVAVAQILTIDGLRRANNWKARLVSAGMVVQLISVLLLGVAVVLLSRGSAPAS